MQILRLSLPTAGLEEAERFYGETLGLPVVTTERGIEVAIGPTILELSPGEARPQHFAFNVRPADFAAVKAWLGDRAALLSDGQGRDQFDFANWRAQAAYFLDPDGSILEIIARDDRPFDGEETDHPFREISEVGIACPDVPAAISEFGLPVYGDPSDEFAAVGDEQGLLILARQNRIWYPDTDVPARPVAGFVDFREGGRDYRVDLETGKRT